MALYLNVLVPDTVSDLRQSIGESLSDATPPTFTPHISLAYGDLPASIDEGLYQKRARTLFDERITFDQVAIVRSAKSIPIDKWTIVTKIDLAG